MKLYVAIFILTLTCCSQQLSAQKDIDDALTDSRNNIVKINLSALVFKNISVQYERGLADKVSFALNVRYIPFGKNPIGKGVEQFAGKESVEAGEFRLGGTGITPELRFYTGKAGTFNGFYLGAFFSYSNYKADLPIKYNSPVKTGIFSGRLKTYTVGLQLGAQWKMGKNGYLDWWALGPNYGTETGDFIFTAALSQSEQTALNTSLDDLKNNLAVKVVDEYNINSNGATMKTKGPWGGIRAMGFTVGVTF